jgi:hypothetical protein
MDLSVDLYQGEGYLDLGSFLFYEYGNEHLCAFIRVSLI